MRPRDFSGLLGQGHLRARLDRLYGLLEEGLLFSLIIFGPPGTGKSALASLIAGCSGSRFVALNAVTSNSAEVKKEIAAAREALLYQEKRTILFIDEIHRFNKLQQDALLPAVEEGTVYLIGVTTQNPSFSINPALRSRCHLLEFRILGQDELSAILDRALADQESGLGRHGYTLAPAARAMIIAACSGDARRALNLLELAASPARQGGEITAADVEASLSGSAVRYDRDGDEHYDVTSAFIKSMRGSDPDAAVYYLARMIEGGEDPLFIARRIMIAASEDVGLADSGALSVAVAAAEAVERVGMPEGGLILAHAALRIALAPKSNSACMALTRARTDLEKNGPLSVPDHLRDSHFPDAEKTGRGTGYKYPHDYPGSFVMQQYLAEVRQFYVPLPHGNEASLMRNLQELREAAHGV